MDQNASIAGFFISKFAIFLAVILLLGAITVSYKGYKNSIQRKKVKTVAQQIVNNAKVVESLPGYFRLERNLISLKKSYNLIISGSFENNQLISIYIISNNKFKKTFLISERINGGNFRIESKNPVKIIISKNDEISLELI